MVDAPKEVDWTAIQADYEAGLSLRTLAAKYGPSKSTIQNRAKAEQWTVGQKIGRGDGQLRESIQLHPEPEISEEMLNTPLSELTQYLTEAEMKDVAEVSLQGLARQLLFQIMSKANTEDLEPKDIKLLADALATCHKILSMRTVERDYAAYDLRVLLSKCTEEERAIIQPVFRAVDAREREQQSHQSGPTNIVPLQKYR